MEDAQLGLLAELSKQLEEARKEIVNLKGERQKIQQDFTSGIMQFGEPKRLRVIALREGFWNGVNYGAEEIQKAVKSLVGKPVRIEHGRDPHFKGKDVGKVASVEWNEFLRAELAELEIYDPEVIEQIEHKKWKAVSVSTLLDVDPKDPEKNGENMNHTEISLVASPACEVCYIINQLSKLEEKGLPYNVPWGWGPGSDGHGEEDHKTMGGTGKGTNPDPAKVVAGTSNTPDPKPVIIYPSERYGSGATGNPAVTAHETIAHGEPVKVPESQRYGDNLSATAKQSLYGHSYFGHVGSDINVCDTCAEHAKNTPPKVITMEDVSKAITDALSTKVAGLSKYPYAYGKKPKAKEPLSTPEYSFGDVVADLEERILAIEGATKPAVVPDFTDAWKDPKVIVQGLSALQEIVKENAVVEKDLNAFTDCVKGKVGGGMDFKAAGKACAADMSAKSNAAVEKKPQTLSTVESILEKIRKKETTPGDVLVALSNQSKKPEEAA